LGFLKFILSVESVRAREITMPWGGFLRSVKQKEISMSWTEIYSEKS
jgi:hypothetical protein